MEKVIIHISDLHVTTHTGNDLKVTPNIDSYLTTDQNPDASDNYIEKFIKKVKNTYPGKEYILLVTGDISNSGGTKEFDYAEKFICKIITELSISKENCLIIPGDHDVHRLSLTNALEETPNGEPHTLHSKKFANFGTFYKKVKNKDFVFDKLIFDHVIIDDKIVMLAINSNYKVGTKSENGFIPIEQLDTEIETLKMELENTTLNYIACWHHNIAAGYENSNSGQWDVENRKNLIAQLEKQNIKLVLNGNEHTSGSKDISSIQTSDCGSLSSIKSDAAFKAYLVSISADEILLKNDIFGLQKTGGNDAAYFWQQRENIEARQPDSFKLYQKNDHKITEADVQELPEEQPAAGRDSESVQIATQIIFYENPEISDKLYSIVRDEKLFHSGHYHWSETSRAHNWIDVSKLLEKSDNIYFAQNAIIDVIEQFSFATDCNLIIGLGYEGNIISSKASIKYGIPYTSLPYSYRYKEHHDYEKKLNYENESGQFKTVLIITDVVNDGRTIRKLIGKREKDFFEKVERIIVISLFYTGQQSINKDILNFDHLPESYDKTEDHVVNNIEYYTIKALRVEKCPYGSNYREECFIYRDELSCVHSFYDDSISHTSN